MYTLVALGLFALLARDVRLDSQFGRMHAFITGVTVAALLLAAGTGAVGLGRAPRRRFGVSREAMVYDPGSGTVIPCRWEDVRVSSRSLLLGRHLVELIDKRGRHLYPRTQVETQLLSRLPAASFLSGWRLQLEALRRGNGAMWTLVVMVGLYLGFILPRSSQPLLMQQLGKQFIDLFR